MAFPISIFPKGYATRSVLRLDRRAKNLYSEDETCNQNCPAGMPFADWHIALADTAIVDNAELDRRGVRWMNWCKVDAIPPGRRFRHAGSIRA
jgi:hypothetical protein